MHRLGDGTKIDDLEAAMAEWRANGRSPSTYCSRADLEQFEDRLGDLVAQLPDGTEIRRHASIKASTYRGGNPKIAHNRVIVGNPAKYAEYKRKKEEKLAAGVAPTEIPWMAEWTYYPDGQFSEILERHEITEETAS